MKKSIFTEVKKLRKGLYKTKFISHDEVFGDDNKVHVSKRATMTKRKLKKCRRCHKPIKWGQAYYGSGTFYAHDTCELRAWNTRKGGRG